MKYLRVLRLRASGDPIAEEYRGWSWYKEPVKPPGYKCLAISDIAYLYCQSLRNVYLKYVLKVEPRVTKPLIEGNVLHNVLYRAIEDVRRVIYESTEPLKVLELIQYTENVVEEIVENVLSIKNIEIDENSKREIVLKACSLYRHIATYYAGEISRVITELIDIRPDAVISQIIPQFSQFHIDGYLVGLSRKLVVDAIMPGVIVEFKFGNGLNIENVGTALAGYAIAIESDYEIPVDYGLVIRISFTRLSDGKYLPRLSVTPVYLSNELRYQFLSLRDEAYDIVYSQKDPGLSKYCPESCPYYHICRGGDI